MDLNFDENAKENRIKEAFDDSLSQIATNLKSGKEYTDLYIDKDIASDIRNLLDDEFQRQGKNFNWCVLRTGTNFYSGKIEHFTGEVIGNKKHYKLKYLK